MNLNIGKQFDFGYLYIDRDSHLEFRRTAAQRHNILIRASLAPRLKMKENEANCNICEDGCLECFQKN